MADKSSLVMKLTNVVLFTAGLIVAAAILQFSMDTLLRRNERVIVFTDPGTKCQYLSSSRGIVPRVTMSKGSYVVKGCKDEFVI